jgi:hypothetical protein
MFLNRLMAAAMREPVLIVNVVTAVAAVIVMCGFSIPVGFEATVGALAVAVATFLSRSLVTPVE